MHVQSCLLPATAAFHPSLTVMPEISYENANFACYSPEQEAEEGVRVREWE